MYLLIWAIVYMQDGQIVSGTMTYNDKFDTQEACEMKLAASKDHMPDYARGFFNLDYDDDIDVKGMCYYHKGI